MRRRLGYWFVGVTCVAACHGGSAQNPDGVAGMGGDAAAPADGGTSGATGTGGGSGATGVGGAIGSTPAEICRAAIAATCERVAVCQGYDLNLCMRVANACPDYYFNADSNRTVAGVTACIPALRARTCTDVANGIYPSCFLGGKRPASAGCAYSSQCAGNVCDGVATCATCRSGGTALGDSCAVIACAYGGFCSSDTKICTDVALIQHAAAGQPCDPSSSPPVGCAGDLVCSRTGAGPAGVCASAAAVGATCPDGPLCTTTTSCQRVNGGVFSCVPRARLGKPCSSDYLGNSPPCLAPAVCSANPGTCIMPAGPGEACDGGASCDLWLSCVGGKCVPFPAANCPADGGVDGR